MRVLYTSDATGSMHHFGDTNIFRVEWEKKFRWEAD